ncbi:hypothetical protein [Pendulispora albinea]|uniref:Uncharacterized protein n=1 Tax=Pendulispora albinea TaxID=2741071 RepID=A0ABZ2M6S8_9BACT
MAFWRTCFAGIAAFGSVGIGCSSSSPEGAVPENPKFQGVYEAAGPGAIRTLAFDEGRYFLWRSPCGAEEICREQGSYKLDDALTTLTLTRATTGAVTSLPFHVSDRANRIAPQSLDPSQLVGGDGESLTRGSGPLIARFTVDGQPFDGRCTELLSGPSSALLARDPPRCRNYPVRVNGQVLQDDPRGRWCEFGACGKSEQANCRDASPAETTEQKIFSQCGSNAIKCKRCRFRHVECGSHAACLQHDNCIRDKMVLNDHESVSMFAALRACDAEIAVSHWPWTWAAWANGGGPQDQWLPFHEEMGCEITDGPCR